MTERPDVPGALNFPALREDFVPLPASEPDGFRHVLFVGTTGAGKTTLVRQLIGTHPATERFPSTSTAKCTIHDTEIILGQAPWRAVVTFVSSDQARGHLNECISAALLAVIRGEDDATVLPRLLDHVEQRFRFSYVLGRGPTTTQRSGLFGDEDEGRDGGIGELGGEAVGIDLTATNELLTRSLTRLRSLAGQLRERVRATLLLSEDDQSEENEDVIQELLEEEHEAELKDTDVREIADPLMDEIEKRFGLLPASSLTRTPQGWPLTWCGSWPAEERGEFLGSVSRFSSNYRPLWGQLLTPLVSGIRVAGPFAPRWKSGRAPKLVLFDGQGLGHTPKSSSSVSTALSRLIDATDAVVLVDNAAQPMQAAALAIMDELASTGNGRKLILAFTHLDQVQGDSLPTTSDKARHVLESAENAISALRDPYAQRVLRERLHAASFFLADLQEQLPEHTTSGRRTIKQLVGLLDAVDQVIERPQPTEASPIYDRLTLVASILRALEAFHEEWRPTLGLGPRRSEKRHWATIKALSRRLAEMGEDEYGGLRPVADLRKKLVVRINRFIRKPSRWEGPEATEEEKTEKYASLASSLGRRLTDLSDRRVWSEQMHLWKRAFSRRGRGSTFVRAEIIGNDIYERAAPVADDTPSSVRNRCLRDVVDEFEAAADEVGAQII